MQESRFNVPMSPDELIQIDYEGVRYKCRPPVGKTEREISTIQASAFDIGPYVADAIVQIDKEHKGKRWGKGERIKAITDTATALAEDHFLEKFDINANYDRTDKIFDLAVVEWEGAPCNIVQGTKPSDYVSSAVKEVVVGMYTDTLNLTDAERKNSSRQPGSSSTKSQKRSTSVKPAKTGKES